MNLTPYRRNLSTNRWNFSTVIASPECGTGTLSPSGFREKRRGVRKGREVRKRKGYENAGNDKMKEHLAALVTQRRPSGVSATWSASFQLVVTNRISAADCSP